MKLSNNSNAYSEMERSLIQRCVDKILQDLKVGTCSEMKEKKTGEHL